MITIMLILWWYIKIVCWIMILPFKLIRWLMFWWVPRRSRRYRNYDDGFTEGFIVGHFWD